MLYAKVKIKTAKALSAPVVEIDSRDIIKPEKAEYLQVREGNSELHHAGFYLDSAYDWQIVEDNAGAIVLVKLRKGAI